MKNTIVLSHRNNISNKVNSFFFSFQSLFAFSLPLPPLHFTPHLHLSQLLYLLYRKKKSNQFEYFNIMKNAACEWMTQKTLFYSDIGTYVDKSNAVSSYFKNIKKWLKKKTNNFLPLIFILKQKLLFLFIACKPIKKSFKKNF